MARFEFVETGYDGWPLLDMLSRLFDMSEEEWDWEMIIGRSEPDRFDFSLYSGDAYSFTGRNLTYDARGFLVSGTITGITESAGMEGFAMWDLYTATGLNIPVSALIALFTTGDRTALEAALFGGNDILIGVDDERIGDILAGGAGNDVYFIQNPDDRVIELAGQGIDKVNTTVSFDARGQHIENIAVAGEARANVVGNELDNVIVGNSQPNAINGGLGADKMVGGGGNDVYYVDNTGDRVVEAAGGGVDTVRASITYTLGAEVENLTLVGSRQINAIGNALNNTLIGNDRPNVLLGHGGRDLMTGGGGADRFDFRAVSDSPWAAFDRITDLEAHDVISLDRIDADTTQADDQAFVLVEAFTRQAGQLTLTYSATGNHTTLAADVDGDGVGDFRVILNGDHSDYSNFRL